MIRRSVYTAGNQISKKKGCLELGSPLISFHCGSVSTPFCSPLQRTEEGREGRERSFFSRLRLICHPQLLFRHTPLQFALGQGCEPICVFFCVCLLLSGWSLIHPPISSSSIFHLTTRNQDPIPSLPKPSPPFLFPSNFFLFVS